MENYDANHFSIIEIIVAERSFTIAFGKEVSTELFHKNYGETISAIRAEPSFELLKNDKPKVYVDLLDPKAILNVISFDDDWQAHNYLIETASQWVLYHWNTVG